MPYKNPEDKKRHNREYRIRMKTRPSVKAKNRAKQKRWLEKNPAKLEAKLKKARQYKRRIGVSVLNKKYKGKEVFKRRQELRRLVEAVGVWKIVDKFSMLARIKRYTLQQISINRKATYLKVANMVRAQWAKEEIFVLKKAA